MDPKYLELLSSAFYQLGENRSAGKYYAQAVAKGLVPDPQVVKALEGYLPELKLNPHETKQ
jgi:hypothetical protein